jgi:hypothetical protein
VRKKERIGIDEWDPEVSERKRKRDRATVAGPRRGEVGLGRLLILLGRRVGFRENMPELEVKVL